MIVTAGFVRFVHDLAELREGVAGIAASIYGFIEEGFEFGDAEGLLKDM